MRPSSVLEDLINGIARERSAAEAAEVERACEAALQGGQYGVLVLRHADGSSIASVDASVPYGEIHQRSS